MTAPFYSDDTVTLHHGDCLDVLRELPDNSVDAVVTDPPYGISFMGKQWDQPGEYGSKRKSTGLNHQRGHKDAALEAGKYDLSPHAMLNFQLWCTEWATECLRVLKPGGHILASGGSRTWHRLASGLEDAGFEIRDSIAWLFGQGFPKSLNVSKAIEAQITTGGSSSRQLRATELAGDGDEYTMTGKNNGIMGETVQVDRKTFTPATPDAEQWQGWGTALKPAFEPIVVGRKPLAGTVAANVLEHGTGGLNIDACRIQTNDKLGGGAEKETTADQKGDAGWTRPWMDDASAREAHAERVRGNVAKAEELGRWPANVVLDDSQATELDKQSGILTSGANPAIRGGDTDKREVYGGFTGGRNEQPRRGTDSGGASRFFPTFKYEAKAATSERPREGDTAHPTVKPLDLMRWLVRLVTPPGGTVLEPFAGSGTTAEACVIEGFQCIAIEREADYLPLIVQRLSKPIQVALDFGSTS